MAGLRAHYTVMASFIVCPNRRAARQADYGVLLELLNDSDLVVRLSAAMAILARLRRVQAGGGRSSPTHLPLSPLPHHFGFLSLSLFLSFFTPSFSTSPTPALSPSCPHATASSTLYLSPRVLSVLQDFSFDEHAFSSVVDPTLRGIIAAWSAVADPDCLLEACSAFPLPFPLLPFSPPLPHSFLVLPSRTPSLCACQQQISLSSARASHSSSLSSAPSSSAAKRRSVPAALRINILYSASVMCLQSP